MVSDIDDFRALGQAIARQTARYRLEAFLVFAGISVMVGSYKLWQYNQREIGRLEERARVAVEAGNKAYKLAKILQDSAKAEKKRGDRLDSARILAEAKVRDTNASLAKTTLKYGKLRDSLIKENAKSLTKDCDPYRKPDICIQDTTLTGRTLAAADSALGQANLAIRALTVKDSISTLAIASLQKRAGFLESVIGEKDKQINALNARLAVASREKWNGRKQGAVFGAAATALVVLTVYASK